MILLLHIFNVIWLLIHWKNCIWSKLCHQVWTERWLEETITYATRLGEMARSSLNFVECKNASIFYGNDDPFTLTHQCVSTITTFQDLCMQPDFSCVHNLIPLNKIKIMKMGWLYNSSGPNRFRGMIPILWWIVLHFFCIKKQKFLKLRTNSGQKLPELYQEIKKARWRTKVFSKQHIRITNSLKNKNLFENLWATPIFQKDDTTTTKNSIEVFAKGGSFCREIILKNKHKSA